MFEGLQEKTELRLGFLLADPQDLKHLLLDISTVDADAAAAHLLPIEDQIVGLRSHLPRFGLQE